MNRSLHEFMGVIRALKDPNRVEILKILHHCELCVSEIRTALGISQACVSKHLSILISAGLAKRRKEKLWAYYRLAETPRSPYAATLLGNLRYWLEEDDGVVESIKKIPETKRNLTS